MAAIYPAIAIAAGNAFDTSVGELLLASAACALLGAMLYALTVALVSRRVGRRATALITVVVVAWIFDAEMVADRGLWIGLRSRDAMVVVTILAIGAVAWLLQTKRGLRRVTQAAGVFSILLPVWTALLFIGERISIDRAMTQSAFFRQLTVPLPPPTFPMPAQRRDIYILFLDGYANERVLEERYNFDNSAFTDSLMTLGFTVARDSRSNYAWTPSSLGSMLSGEHVTGLEADSLGRKASWDILYATIRRSRVLAAFARAGYRIFVVPSAYFPGTRSTEVGVTYVPEGSRSIRARLARMPIVTTVWHMTTPGRLLEKAGRNLAPTSVALAPFAGMMELARMAGPKVVVAHSLIAHTPYQFASDCTERRRQTGDESAYTDQIQCTNREVMRVITAIRHADRAPIILLFADHGSASHGLPIAEPAERFDSARARERFGAFRAQLLPTGIAVADSTTPVNVMRQVVGAELGVDLPMVADSSYWSSFNPPYHYVAVDSMVRRPVLP
jgi:hypothetical protein